MNKEMLLKGATVAVVGGIIAKSVFDKVVKAKKEALDAEYVEVEEQEDGE